MEHKILSLIDSCTGCFACQNSCPVDAISLPENEEGFYFPVVDTDKCINCCLCDKICPAINEPEYHHMQHAYYGWSKDDTLRKKSSSGGAFGLLSRQIIAQGGKVYGAAFRYEPQVRLECLSSDDVQLDELQKSKYVQNYIGDAYRKILADLKDGKKVLFCGTPCEVVGLKNYLRKDYDNLICVDFICHGVPSMSMLRDHLKYKGIENVRSIDFRPKNRVWVDDIVIKYKKNTTYTNCWWNDEYYKNFQNFCNIRRSCYNCRYCNGNRLADITLADFWGYKAFNPKIFDPKGISLILANTALGKQLMDALLADINCFFEEIDKSYAEYVYAKDRRDPKNNYDIEKRNRFFGDVVKHGYKKALRLNNLNIKRSQILIYHVKRIIRKILK